MKKGKITNQIMMKACVLPKKGTEDHLTVMEIPRPIPGDHEILVQVNYALVTPTDLAADSESSGLEKVFSSLIRPKSGVYGEMYAGIVVEVGKEVKGLKVNDIVYGTNGTKLGAYAEYICVKDTTAFRKIPNGLNEIDALTLLDGAITALPFLRDKGLIKDSKKVLVIGASGSVGSMAVQIAKYYGADVTGVCSTKNLEVVSNLGCDNVIDYTQNDYTKDAIKYDIIFDAVGKSSFKKCINILNEEGRYLVTVPNLSLLLKSIFNKKQTGKRALFTATGLRKPELKLKDLEMLERLALDQQIKPLIGQIYSLNELKVAQKLVRSGHKVGNIIIDLRK